MSSFVRRLRATGTVAVMCALSLNGLHAQSVDPAARLISEPDFVKWAFTQGGLLLALFGLGWSYRRDLIGIIKQQEDRNKILMEFIQESTKALTRMVDAVGNCPLRGFGDDNRK